jgi:hypothetical protein
MLYREKSGNPETFIDVPDEYGLLAEPMWPAKLPGID